jgi:hypothetical protein
MAYPALKRWAEICCPLRGRKSRQDMGSVCPMLNGAPRIDAERSAAQVSVQKFGDPTHSKTANEWGTRLSATLNPLPCIYGAEGNGHQDFS